MEKLFDDFKKVSLEDWKSQIEKDLKGKPMAVLNSNPEMDIEIKAYHHADEKRRFKSAVQKENNDWEIRKAYSTESNSQLLSDLNEGVNSIAVKSSHFEAITKDVLFEHISGDVKVEKFDQLTFPVNFNLNFDVIGRAAVSGTRISDLSDFETFVKHYKSNKTIWVDGTIYGDAGATSVQELAFSAAHLNEYIQHLYSAGFSLEEINSKIVVSISVTNNYFVNIAKTRVVRSLVNGILKGYDASFEPAPIHLIAKTSVRYQAINDSNSNLLRQTTQAMSAVIGGCDALTVVPFLSDDKGQNELNQRMAKNIQLILKEESYLNKVVDPSDGSYYIDDISDQLLNKSWQLFKDIENEGGFLKALQADFIQTKIETSRNYLVEKLNNKESTFLGVNKFQSSLEKWINVKVDKTAIGIDFKAITTFRLEQHFQNSVEA